MLLTTSTDVLAVTDTLQGMLRSDVGSVYNVLAGARCLLGVSNTRVKVELPSHPGVLK